jgi:uncharacterized protein (DUF58 family)
MRSFVPFLLALFLIAVLLRVDFVFTILYLFLLLALLTRFWLRRATAQIHACRRFENHAHFGDQVTIEVILHNTGRLPIPWMELHESVPVDLHSTPTRGQVVSLGAHERWGMRYTLNCRKRGFYTLGPLTAKNGDLLGIERVRPWELAPEPFIVYPQIVPIHQLHLPTRSPFMALPAQSPLFEDPTRVVGVRDYQRGDPPRRIHWTATANTGRLLVKRYQPAIARETLVCLDLDGDNYEQRHLFTATELAIVVAASVANHIIVREGLAAGLVTMAHDSVLDEQVRFFLAPRSERAHLMNVLEVLARVQVSNSTSFVDLLRRESVRLSWGATMLVITGRETEELFETLMYLRRAGFAVTLVLVQPGRPSAELRQRAELLSVPVHRVWQERDLKSWR